MVKPGDDDSHESSPNGKPPPDDDASSEDASSAKETGHAADGGPRVSRIRVGEEDILVLSVPLPKLRYPDGTTVAEQEIIDLVLQGHTAKEIAEIRGASLRTVTTQLGTIFRKAGVNSQPELIAAMTETDPE